MKGSWRAAEAWHYEQRPGKAIGVGVASVAVEGLGLKGSYKEVEAWHPKESHLGKVHPNCSKGLQKLGNGRVMGQCHNSSSTGVEPVVA